MAELVAFRLAGLELVPHLLHLVLQTAKLLELLLIGLGDALEPVVVVENPEQRAELAPDLPPATAPRAPCTIGVATPLIALLLKLPSP